METRFVQNAYRALNLTALKYMCILSEIQGLFEHFGQSSPSNAAIHYFRKFSKTTVEIVKSWYEERANKV